MKILTILFILFNLLSGEAFAATYSISPTTYAWESTSTTLPSWESDCSLLPPNNAKATIAFPNGFLFNFNGQTYNSLRLIANGRVQFGPDTGHFRSTNATNYPEGASSSFAGCPSAQQPTNLVGGYWIDLDPGTGPALLESLLGGGDPNRMGYQLKGTAPNRYFVVSWENIRVSANLVSALVNLVLSGTPYVDLQMLFYENGFIKVNYGPTVFANWSNLPGKIGVEVSNLDFTNYTVTPTANSAILISPINNIEIVPASLNPSVCAPMEVIIRTKRQDGTLYPFTGRISLTTSSGSGTFSLKSGSGTLSAGSDNGQAIYTMSSSDNGEFRVNLNYDRAENLTITATESLFTTVSATTSTLSFRDNTFVVESTDAMNSGQSTNLEVVAGRPHAFKVSYFKKDPTTGLCSVLPAYTGSKNLDAWFVKNAAVPAGAPNPTISTSSACSSPISLPASAPALNTTSNNLPLTFTNGVANFFLCSSDVNRGDLFMRDDTRTYARNNDPLGSSNFTIRPFALLINNIRSTTGVANPSGTATGGSMFVKAGENFLVDVSAVRYASGQDTVAPGIPDASANLTGNALTASYASDVTLGIKSFTPAAGTAGTLSTNTIAANAFSAGKATQSLSYSDVGSIVLNVSGNNVFGGIFSTPIQSSSVIGRFVPFKLDTAGSLVGNGCLSNFYYQGDSLLSDLRVVAKNKQGGITNNYITGSYTNALSLDSSKIKVIADYSGVNQVSRLSGLSLGGFVNGQANITSSVVSFAKSTDNSASIGQLKIGVQGVDADGISFDYDTADNINACVPSSNCTYRSFATLNNVYRGRLSLQNGFSSTSGAPIAIVSKREYWNGLGWVTNTFDSCSSISSVGKGVPTGIGDATISIGGLSQGVQVLRVVPVTSNAGKIDLSVNLGTGVNANSCLGSLVSSPENKSFLQDTYCAASQDPSASAVWGLATPSNQKVIIIKEN